MRRRIIKSLNYFRDLGGIKTIDGFTVKSGVLFRTSEIKELTEKDRKTLLEDYHVDICIDLRTDEEVGLAPDLLNGVIDYRHIPLVSNENNPAVTRDTRVAILKQRMKEEGGMKGHIIRLYKLLINDKQAQAGYKKIFDLLLEAKGNKTIFYHCTQGKDRTGLLSAFILFALEVDEDTILKDYLEFNSYRVMRRFWIYLGMLIVFFPTPAAKHLNYALVARKYYFEAAMEEINKYGGPVSYLKKAIGLTDEDIAKLKEYYLVK